LKTTTEVQKHSLRVDDFDESRVSCNNKSRGLWGKLLALRTLAFLIAVALMFSKFTAGPQAQDLRGHSSSLDVNRALGVECSHCHTGSDFADATKPTFDFARRMARMVDGINDGPLKGIGSLTCWSCHRGQPVPPRIPRAAWESIVVAHAADFAGGRASLGLTMGVYAASLGVDCSHCHVSRDWRDASKPAHQTVKVMSAIFELIPTYFDRAQRVPSTQCYMCHQGHIKVEQTDPR